MKSKSTLLALCFILTLVIINLHVENDVNASGSLNILLIITDDMIYSDLSLYGGVNVITPNTDPLTGEG